jgi:hypothetical protein
MLGAKSRKEGAWILYGFYKLPMQTLIAYLLVLE